MVPNVADMSFNGISFGAYLNNVTVSHDEVRVGMTWADVVGNTVSQLQLAQQTNNTSSLLLAASPNYNYQVQGATNVAGPWTNIGNVAASSLGIGWFADTNATSSLRFYRAMNGTALLMPPSTDIVIADFEQPTYGAWVTTGTAFGSGPAQGTLPNQNPVSGYFGSGLVNSYYGTDASTGTLTSPPFVITKPYLDFLIAGGNLPGQECMNLIISNVAVATATGANSETLTPAQWNVSAYLGQTATLQIVDSATGGWGHVLIDQITLSDTVFPSLSRIMPADQQSAQPAGEKWCRHEARHGYGWRESGARLQYRAGGWCARLVGVCGRFGVFEPDGHRVGEQSGFRFHWLECHRANQWHRRCHQFVSGDFASADAFLHQTRLAERRQRHGLLQRSISPVLSARPRSTGMARGRSGGAMPSVPTC